MGNTKNVKRSFYINIALLVVIVNAILLVAIFTAVYFNIRSIYFENYQKQTVDVSNFVAAQINGDKIEEYSEKFNKDSYYYELNSMLYKLKDIFHIESLYIMVDLGDLETYTYIYDAILDEETLTFDDSHYGTTEPKSVFPGSEYVLRTGLPFKEAAYFESDEYGRVFYSYAPIINSRGDVVAFLGTDINADPMFARITEITVFLVVLGVSSFAIIFFIVMFYCRKFISKPIIKLSADIAGFSDGKLEIDISDKLLNREDELGLIYRSFSSVVLTIGNLMNDLNQTTGDVIKGQIDAHINYGNTYKGSYESIAESMALLMENTRKIFNLMPVYFIIYDYGFNLLYRNTPADSFINTTHNDKSFANDIIQLAQESLREVFCEFTLSTDESHTGSFNIALSDTAIRHFNYFLIKNNPRGDIKNICCVLTDVTGYVEMSEKALASNVAKSEFLSKMSHEIRTPMNAIIGMTEIAKRNTNDIKVLGNLEKIQSSSTHLLTIINDILDVSKIESGKMELSNEVFNLNKVLSDISAITEKLASDNGIRFKIVLENPINSLMMFLGDEVRIKQVLINLLSNAVKFSPKNSEVLLIVRLEEGIIPNKNNKKSTTKIYFAVRDSGIGIAPDKLSVIFEAFEQGGTEITRNFGGTGLGLPISNAFVQLMGGEKIYVSSEPGKGSEFSFSLELEGTDISNEDSNVLDERIDFSGKRIMLVDDIEINREIVISLLDDCGVEIDCCNDGTVAVEKFSASPENYYDLIFMDIQMKMMDGYTATRNIRALDRKDASAVKIIAMSANAFQSDIAAGSEAGMNDYITKPIEYDNVIKKMKKYLLGGS